MVWQQLPPHPPPTPTPPPSLLPCQPAVPYRPRCPSGSTPACCHRSCRRPTQPVGGCCLALAGGGGGFLLGRVVPPVGRASCKGVAGWRARKANAAVSLCLPCCRGHAAAAAAGAADGSSRDAAALGGRPAAAGAPAAGQLHVPGVGCASRAGGGGGRALRPGSGGLHLTALSARGGLRWCACCAADAVARRLAVITQPNQPPPHRCIRWRPPPAHTLAGGAQCMQHSLHTWCVPAGRRRPV